MRTGEYRAYVGQLKALARPGRQAAHERLMRQEFRRRGFETLLNVGLATLVGAGAAWAISREKKTP